MGSSENTIPYIVENYLNLGLTEMHFESSLKILKKNVNRGMSPVYPVDSPIRPLSNMTSLMPVAYTPKELRAFKMAY